MVVCPEGTPFRNFMKVMDFFKSTDGQEILKSGFRSAGITDAIRKACDGQKITMDPYDYFKGRNFRGKKLLRFRGF